MKSYLFSMNDRKVIIIENILDLRIAISELVYHLTTDEENKNLLLKSTENLSNSESISLINSFLHKRNFIYIKKYL